MIQAYSALSPIPDFPVGCSSKSMVAMCRHSHSSSVSQPHSHDHPKQHPQSPKSEPKHPPTPKLETKRVPNLKLGCGSNAVCTQTLNPRFPPKCITTQYDFLHYICFVSN